MVVIIEMYTVVEERSVRDEVIPKGMVDCTEERMPE